MEIIPGILTMALLQIASFYWNLNGLSSYDSLVLVIDMAANQNISTLFVSYIIKDFKNASPTILESDRLGPFLLYFFLKIFNHNKGGSGGCVCVGGGFWYSLISKNLAHYSLSLKFLFIL